MKGIFFKQYASMGRQLSLDEFQSQYEPKKGGRFHLQGITYEIGNIEVDDKGLQFEISSKIPKEQLTEKMPRENYFEAVKKNAVIKGKKPVYFGMDDIVHKIGDKEIKKRDYIRLKYHYDYSELFDEKAILEEVKKIAEGKSQTEIPRVSGVQSPVGCLTLAHIKDSIYSEVKKCTQALVDANEKVRKTLK